MPRTIYTLIVDCPDRASNVAHEIGALADALLAAVEGTCNIHLGTIVPTDNGFGLIPIVRLVERSP